MLDCKGSLFNIYKGRLGLDWPDITMEGQGSLIFIKEAFPDWLVSIMSGKGLFIFIKVAQPD